MMEAVSAFPERRARVSTLELFFDLVFVFTNASILGECYRSRANEPYTGFPAGW
jgi:hypothetical protein